MKLIDLLVQELPKRGGWPDNTTALVQNSSGYVYQAGGGDYLFRFMRTDDWELAEVTRDQYEAALQQAVWNGEGLPPVGCECELYDCEKWIEVKIKYTGDNVVVVHEFGSAHPERVFHLAKKPENFRPIRTEAERKREEAVEALSQLVEYRHGCGHMPMAGWIYDAIAAGSIPGIKLSD